MVRLAMARSASLSVTLITLPWQCLVTQECGRSKQYQISADNYTQYGLFSQTSTHKQGCRGQSPPNFPPSFVRLCRRQVMSGCQVSFGTLHVFYGNAILRDGV